MEAKKASKESTSLISEHPRMTNKDKALLKQKLMKFVCGTCDLGKDATPAHCEALPRVAEILCMWF